LARKGRVCDGKRERWLATYAAVTFLQGKREKLEREERVRTYWLNTVLLRKTFHLDQEGKWARCGGENRREVVE